MEKDRIMQLFNNYLNNSGRKFYSDFFIGVTDDVNKRLFEEHMVPKSNSWYIYAPANTHENAMAVKKHYHNLGMRTSNRRTSRLSKMVYCYGVSPFTVEK